MNWLGMARRLVVAADGARNEWLALLVLLLPATATATAFDGSVSLELSGGNRTLSGSVIADWGLVPDTLYLVGAYGMVKQAAEPDIVSTPSHLFGLGVDFIPSLHWMTSLNASFSPKATDSQVLSTLPRIEVSGTRRSAQGVLAAAYQSAGLGNLEWGVDASVLGAWYELSSHARLPLRTFDNLTNLFLVKPNAGATLTLFGTTDASLRGTYTAYSTDPTTAGGFDAQVPEAVRQLVAMFEQIQTGLMVFEKIQSGLVQADTTASFSSAPPWFEVRGAVVHRFGEKVTGRIGYTFMRYVHGLGSAHIINTRWSWKIAPWFRVWVGATAQYDVLSTGSPFWSGYGTLGGELATE